MAKAPVYKPYDYTKAYNAAEKAARDAANAAYNQAKAGIDAEGARLSPEYDKMRSGIYTNARVGAIGNNEALAAQGLGGGLYNSPTSGVSETSRVRQDVSMQNSINNASLQEQTQRDALAQQLIQTGYTRDQSIAEYMAQASIDRAKSTASENQYAAQYDFNAYQAQNAEQQAAQTSAMNEISMFGKVMTKAAASALGVPIGTTSFQYQQYQDAKKKVGSGGSSGGSSGRNSGGDYYGGVSAGAAAIDNNLRMLWNSNADSLSVRVRQMGDILDNAIKNKKITKAEADALVAKYT